MFLRLTQEQDRRQTHVHSGKLVEGMLKEAEESGKAMHTVPAFVVGLIAELFTCTLHQHGAKSKYFLLRGNTSMRMMGLMDRPEMWLRLAGIRFVRTCLGVKDDFFVKHVMRFRMLDKVFETFA